MLAGLAAPIEDHRGNRVAAPHRSRTWVGHRHTASSYTVSVGFYSTTQTERMDCRTLDFRERQFAHATAIRRRFAGLLPFRAAADASDSFPAMTASIYATINNAILLRMRMFTGSRGDKSAATVPG